MNRAEATQYQVSGVGVMAGVELDFREPPEAPCRDCGRMVDLSNTIIVSVMKEDGTEAESKMTEANARALMAQVEMGSPPVLCDQHEEMELP